MKIVQCMIQIDRPKRWTKDKVNDIIKEIKTIEKFNAIRNKTICKWERRWKSFNSQN